VECSGGSAQRIAQTGKYEVACVPRYFFNLFDDVDTVDEEGLEISDREAAETAGLVYARAIAAEQVGHGRLTLSHRIEIADASGAVLKIIRFDDAVHVEA
jgi:hypothetical protein